jgi:hypothetical protein
MEFSQDCDSGLSLFDFISWLNPMAGSASFLARFLQRFPRVRASEDTRNGEDQAKTGE